MLFLTNLGIILDFHKLLSLIRGLGESFERNLWLLGSMCLILYYALFVWINIC